MPSVKVFYVILFSGLVLYFLLYSLLVRKLPGLPVVKIYFEDESPKNDIYSQQYFAHEKSPNFEANKIEESDLSTSPPAQEFFAREEKPSIEITNEEQQRAKRDILLSFLEGLGIPVNKIEMPLADTSRNAPPLVNPNGVSLRKLMKKFDEDLSLETDKPCPRSHLDEGMFTKFHSLPLLVYLIRKQRAHLPVKYSLCCITNVLELFSILAFPPSSLH